MFGDIPVKMYMNKDNAYSGLIICAPTMEKIEKKKKESLKRLAEMSIVPVKEKEDLNFAVSPMFYKVIFFPLEHYILVKKIITVRE